MDHVVEPRHYSLRQIKGEQFYGYASPLDVLKDIRKFMKSRPNATFITNTNDYALDTDTFGGSLIYEDI